MTKEELIEKQEEIDRAIQKVYGTDCSLDGITDIDTYLQNELHTLWILKEMNRDFQKTGLFNQREFNKNGAGYNLRTWGNVMKVTAGIREYAASDGKRFYAKDLPQIGANGGNKEARSYYSETSQSEIFPLDEIAMINVHKGIGTNRSSDAFIASHYAHPEIRKIILDQVEYINPELIIVCNHVEQLLCDLAGVASVSEYTKDSESDNLYYKKGNRLIISTGHPLVMQKGMTSEKYCDAILDIVYDQI